MDAVSLLSIYGEIVKPLLKCFGCSNYFYIKILAKNINVSN